MASRWLTRRNVLTGLGVLGVGAAAVEYASLRGAFDFRRSPGASARERFMFGRASIASDDSLSAGALLHVGHSTHLLSIAGARFLTDPWFNDPAFGALSHTVAPAVRPEEIGALDAILVSHDHADHADPRALDRLDKRASVIVATTALAARARALGFSTVTVLAPWESMNVGHAKVTAVPAVHDIYEIGFVLQGAGRSVFFAGDTRLHDDLAAIAERLRPSMALLPVDGTRLTGGAMHVMTPDDAVVAARTLRLRHVVPSHAEAYFSDPLVRVALATSVPRASERFAQAMRTNLPDVRCDVPQPGDVVAISPRVD